MHLEINSELSYHVVEKDSAPLVFEPFVDFEKLTEPSVIHAY